MRRSDSKSSPDSARKRELRHVDRLACVRFCPVNLQRILLFMRSEILLTLSILNKKNGPENSGCMTDLNMVFKLGSWNPGVPWSNQGITEKFRWKRQHGASVLLPDKAS